MRTTSNMKTASNMKTTSNIEKTSDAQNQTKSIKLNLLMQTNQTYQIGRILIKFPALVAT